ncbi:unnamed protein product [Clonostachys rosea]|uniref:Protein kinase domain-containing protein n=1 Tax=Bionectria ochroleuca TaxID=29856 RepID=A0ABY6U2K8_BIOOC|nr:unnamed protein product [Clonostachys rosea]
MTLLFIFANGRLPPYLYSPKPDTDGFRPIVNRCHAIVPNLHMITGRENTILVNASILFQPDNPLGRAKDDHQRPSDWVLIYAWGVIFYVVVHLIPPPVDWRLSFRRVR